MGFPFLSTMKNATRMKDELDNTSYQNHIYAKFKYKLN